MMNMKKRVMVSVMLLVIMLVTIIAFITGVTEGGKVEVMD
nr:hypothetical protein [Tanacetum cinerariifolium]